MTVAVNGKTDEQSRELFGPICGGGVQHQMDHLRGHILGLLLGQAEPFFDVGFLVCIDGGAMRVNADAYVHGGSVVCVPVHVDSDAASLICIGVRL